MLGFLCSEASLMYKRFDKFKKKNKIEIVCEKVCQIKLGWKILTC